MGTSMTKAAGKGEGNHPHDCFTTGDFKKGKRLGSGAFSTVYLGRKKTDSELYAIKVIKKAGLSDEDKQGLKQEIAILKELKSDLVMKLYAVYDNKKTYQLVTELVEGGELFERIVEKDSYSETEAKKVVKNLINAVAYVHAHDIVHRDLKPENVRARV
jgi:serine/threonine protein kinase